MVATVLGDELVSEHLALKTFRPLKGRATARFLTSGGSKKFSSETWRQNGGACSFAPDSKMLPCNQNLANRAATGQIASKIVARQT